MAIEEKTILCQWCRQPTSMLGTKCRNRCWELNTLIEQNPELAKKMLAKLTSKAKKAQAMSKAECVGCDDNYYNGNNDIGVKECWSFPTAKLIMKKRVSIKAVPPWKAPDCPTLRRPICYREKGYIYVKPESEY